MPEKREGAGRAEGKQNERDRLAFLPSRRICARRCQNDGLGFRGRSHALGECILVAYRISSNTPSQKEASPIGLDSTADEVPRVGLQSDEERKTTTP